MIYHFRTPRRISAVMRLIATYMSLSRVQSLKQLHAIGLTTAISDIIENMVNTRFLNISGEKERADTDSG